MLAQGDRLTGYRCNALRLLAPYVKKKLAIVVLNQVIRPFTAKWHRIKLQSGFDDPKHCKAFRKELAELQKQLDKYAKMLADIAKVEDLTVLEKT